MLCARRFIGEPSRYLSCGIPPDYNEWLHVLRYNSPRRYDCAIADADTAKNDRPRANPDVFPDYDTIKGRFLAVSYPFRERYWNADLVDSMIETTNDLHVGRYQTEISYRAPDLDDRSPPDRDPASDTEAMDRSHRRPAPKSQPVSGLHVTRNLTERLDSPNGRFREAGNATSIAWYAYSSVRPFRITHLRLAVIHPLANRPF